MLFCFTVFPMLCILRLILAEVPFSGMKAREIDRKCQRESISTCSVMQSFHSAQSRLLTWILGVVFLGILGGSFGLFGAGFASSTVFLGFYLLLYPAVIVFLIVMLGIGVGNATLQVLRLSFPRHRYEYYFSALLGLGIVSHAVLFLGLLQGYRHHWAILVMLIGLLAVARRIARFFRLFWQWLDRQITSQWRADEMLMLFLVAVCVIVYLAAATLPPVNYDVLEYHLGVPKRYIQHGGICPVPYNFFSSLPCGVEMLYVLGLLLEGGVSDGAPHLMTFVFYLLSVVGIVLMISRLEVRRIWWFAGIVLFSIHPIIFKSGLDAFNDLGTSSFVVAALLAWVFWIHERRRSYFLLSGACLGFAIATKYTAIGLYVVPYCVLLVPLGLFLSGGGSRPRESVAHDVTAPDKPCGSSAVSKPQRAPFFGTYAIALICLVGIIVLVFVPIAIKNIMSAGSPFYPFLRTIFPVSGWTAEQGKLLMNVHHPVSLLSSAYAATVLRRTAVPGFFFIAVPVLVFLLRKIVSIEIGLLVYGVLGFLVWNLIAESADRFLTSYVAVAVIVAMVVISEVGSLRIIGPIVLSGCALFGLSGIYVLFAKSEAFGIPQVALAIESRSEFQRQILGPLADAADFVNSQLEPDAKLLFIYEARTYPFDRSVVANTVFDQSPLLLMAKQASSAQALANMLKAQGITYCLVNERELIRLIQFYGPREQLRVRGLEPLLESAPLQLVHYPEFYAPYFLDSGYQFHKEKMYQFMVLLRQAVIFQAGRADEPQIYVARLP